MADKLQQLGSEIKRQAQLPGAPTGHYASLGAGARAGAVPSPGYVLGEDGRAVRFFIPGRSPFYKPGARARYVLGRPRDAA